MPYQTGLAKALVDQGLTVYPINGWKTRGSSYFAPFYTIAHWTAGPRTGDRPSLSIVVNGRTGLPGPLCNVFLPRGLTAAQRVVYVVAAGRANHAGYGYYAGANGNTDLWGTETEWSGRDGELTDFQEWAWPRINAAYRSLGSRGEAGHDQYALPRGRKQDINDYIYTLRANTDAVARGEGDDMPSEEWLQKEMSRHAENVHSAIKKDIPGLVWGAKHPAAPSTDMWGFQVSTYNRVAEQNAIIENLVKAVAAISGGESFDQEKLLEGVRSSARDGVKDAIESIESTTTVTIDTGEE